MWTLFVRRVLTKKRTVGASKNTIQIIGVGHKPLLYQKHYSKPLQQPLVEVFGGDEADVGVGAGSGDAAAGCALDEAKL